MEVNRTKFLKSLNHVKVGLAAKEIIEQSTFFVFKDGQVITFNDEIAVHANLDEGFDIEGAVPAKELIGILTRFSGEKVEITENGGELSLKCGKGKAGITLQSSISLRVDEINIPKKWIDLPTDFIEGLKLCIPSAAGDLTYPILATLHITKDHVESSDNIRLSRKTWAEKTKIDKSILISADIAKELAKMNIIKFWQEQNWIHFSDKDETIFSCRTTTGQYPKLDDYLEVEPIGSLIFPDTIKDMLDKAGVFCSTAIQQDSSVSLSINEKGLMTIKGEGDYGWYEESCRVKWDGDPIKFSIHPNHLLSILSTSNKADIGENRIKFTADNFVHVVALETE